MGQSKRLWEELLRKSRENEVREWWEKEHAGYRPRKITPAMFDEYDTWQAFHHAMSKDD
jgi:hypothetical protein